MDLLFFSKGTVKEVRVSDDTYEFLAHHKLSKIVVYKKWDIIVDGEEDKVFATKLNSKNRSKIVNLLTHLIIEEVKKCILLNTEKKLLQELLVVLDNFKDKENLYFSY